MLYRHMLRLISIFATAFIVVFALMNFGIITAHGDFFLTQIWQEINPPDYELAASSANTIEKPVELPVIHPPYYDGVERPLPNQATLVIPKLDVSVPIVFDAQNKVDDIYNRLYDGVVNHPLTVKPGEDGLSIILGHSSKTPWDNNKYGTVFALLGKLEPGDRFHVEYSDKRRFDYEIKESFTFNPFDENDPAIARFEAADHPKGTILATCWPIGSNIKRLAVRAEEL